MVSNSVRSVGLVLTLSALFTGGAGGAPLSQSTPNEMISALFDGPPRLAQSYLDDSAYVKEELQRLTDPSIAYVNWEAIEEILLSMGYKDLPKTLTPDLAKALLERGGYAKPMQQEGDSAYTEGLRTLYSIRYGGHWINYNFGSGRNGASGVVDIKGIGKTALVRPWADSGHSSGGLGLREAIKEAIWSNLLHHMLPNGANRVLFIFTTGTRVDPARANSEARALLVREDPLRPAYFQRNDGVRQDLMSDELRGIHTAADDLRMQRLLPRLNAALPKPEGEERGLTRAQQLHVRFIEMVDRIAESYAFGYASQVVLAGATTSNVEITGRALDYGVTTAVIGYPKVNLLPGEAPNGSTETLKNDIVLELAGDLRQDLPADLVSGLPSDAELIKRVDDRFRISLAQAFLEMAGSPKEFSKRLVEHSAGRNLGETLIQIAQAGNSETLTWQHNGMPRSGTYNVERILKSLLNQDQNKLAAALTDKALRDQLIREFQLFKAELEKQTLAEGISAPSLKTYMQLASAARSRSLYEMRSGRDLFAQMDKVSLAFTSKESSTVVQEYINAIVARNTREHLAAPYELSVTVGSRGRSNLGETERIVFNLKTGLLQRKVERTLGFDRPVVSMSGCAGVLD